VRDYEVEVGHSDLRVSIQLFIAECKAGNAAGRGVCSTRLCVQCLVTGLWFKPPTIYLYIYIYISI
jgi:hypothetical protein